MSVLVYQINFKAGNSISSAQRGTVLCLLFAYSCLRLLTVECVQSSV